jgi:RNA polymerase sigma-70 factor (ECF subfamily)
MGPIERFIEHAPWAQACDARQLRSVLEELLGRARREYPEIASDLGEFAGALAERVDASGDPLPDLERLYVPDLYLAWALAQGDRAAFVRFEREFVPRLTRFIKRELLPPPGELEQAVMTRLFVAREGQPPRILQYNGRGPLAAWVRMATTRVALDLRRSADSKSATPSLESPTLPTDPELDYLKLRHAADFKLALERALGSLSDREVALLRLSLLDGLSPDAIGTMYGVSGRTARRWVAETRQKVVLSTREALKAHLALSGTELDSLLGLVRSQIHLSLHRLLLERGGSPQA